MIWGAFCQGCSSIHPHKLLILWIQDLEKFPLWTRGFFHKLLLAIALPPWGGSLPVIETNHIWIKFIVTKLLPCAQQGSSLCLVISETSCLLTRHAQKDLHQGAFLQWRPWSSKWATCGLDPKWMGGRSFLEGMPEACWCLGFESFCSRESHSSISSKTPLVQEGECLGPSCPPLAFCQGSSFCQGRDAAAICHLLFSPLAPRNPPVLGFWTLLQTGLDSCGSCSKKGCGGAIWWHIQLSPCHFVDQCS